MRTTQASYGRRRNDREVGWAGKAGCKNINILTHAHQTSTNIALSRSPTTFQGRFLLSSPTAALRNYSPRPRCMLSLFARSQAARQQEARSQLRRRKREFDEGRAERGKKQGNSPLSVLLRPAVEVSKTTNIPRTWNNGHLMESEMRQEKGGKKRPIRGFRLFLPRAHLLGFT